MSLIVTLTGPSCAGKSTLEKKLKQVGYEAVISTTTRPIRDGEIDGKNYYYVTREEFNDMQENGELVENIEFNGNYYGVSVTEIERVFSTGKPIVLVVEPVGLKQIKTFASKMGWEVHSCFIDNPRTVVTKRFLSRFASELEAGSNKQKLVETYTKRLEEMSTTEVEWQIEAYEQLQKQGGYLYDTIYKTFDETNDKEVVQDFVELL